MIITYPSRVSHEARIWRLGNRYPARISRLASGITTCRYLGSRSSETTSGCGQNDNRRQKATYKYPQVAALDSVHLFSPDLWLSGSRFESLPGVPLSQARFGVF